jgi:hypothetical protein
MTDGRASTASAHLRRTGLRIRSFRRFAADDATSSTKSPATSKRAACFALTFHLIGVNGDRGLAALFARAAAAWAPSVATDGGSNGVVEEVTVWFSTGFSKSHMTASSSVA